MSDIGCRFTLGGKLLEIRRENVENSCEGCVYEGDIDGLCYLVECTASERDAISGVIFVEVQDEC